MTSIEKCEYLKNKGYTYNPETGDVFSHRGKLINGKSSGYITLGFKLSNYTHTTPSHQFAFYMTYGFIPKYIDHINRNRADNRIINLREVTNQENCFNQKAKGYYWSKKHKKWRGQIVLNGKKAHLGLFDTEEEARQAYLQAKEIYHKIG
jgi:hypothetical protein